MLPVIALPFVVNLYADQHKSVKLGVFTRGPPTGHTAWQPFTDYCIEFDGMHGPNDL